jgi:hypothetical protein
MDLRSFKTGVQTGRVTFGLVKYIHARKDVLNSRGYVDPVKMMPTARIGDVSYARVSDIYRMPVKSWSKEQEAVEKTGLYEDLGDT